MESCFLARWGRWSNPLVTLTGQLYFLKPLERGNLICQKFWGLADGLFPAVKSDKYAPCLIFFFKLVWFSVRFPGSVFYFEVNYAEHVKDADLFCPRGFLAVSSAFMKFSLFRSLPLFTCFPQARPPWQPLGP